MPNNAKVCTYARKIKGYEVSQPNSNQPTP